MMYWHMPLHHHKAALMITLNIKALRIVNVFIINHKGE
jgi:hypothetical protein